MYKLVPAVVRAFDIGVNQSMMVNGNANDDESCWRIRRRSGSCIMLGS